MIEILDSVTLKDLIYFIVGTITVLSVVVEKVNKFPFKPWSNFFRWIGNCLNRDMNEKLEIIEQQTFDLILLDVNMPEMDGLETLRLIRKKYQTPVVLMTADKTLDTSTEYGELGCDDFITKPFLPLLLKEIIHNMTERTNIKDEE